jgi:hypothetical protein
MISLSPIAVQSKWWTKRGAFGISMRPYGAPIDPGSKPEKPRKTDGLNRQESKAWARFLRGWP